MPITTQATLVLKSRAQTWPRLFAAKNDPDINCAYLERSATPHCTCSHRYLDISFTVRVTEPVQSRRAFGKLLAISE
jgi:hypothetical protein